MCNHRYEIWDTELMESDYDNAMIDEVSGVNDASHLKAIKCALEYSAKMPDNKVSVSAWDCGGPHGVTEYFLDGTPLTEPPRPGIITNGRFYPGHSGFHGRVVGQKVRKQRKELLNMLNLIETTLAKHPDGCDCDVCELFRSYIRDDKTKIAADLNGYRLYTKEDAKKLDEDIAESKRKEEACVQWMEWLLENYQLLQIDGFAEETRTSMEKFINNLKGEKNE